MTVNTQYDFTCCIRFSLAEYRVQRVHHFCKSDFDGAICIPSSFLFEWTSFSDDGGLFAPSTPRPAK